MKILALDTARQHSDATFLDMKTGTAITESRMERNNEALFFMIRSVLRKADSNLEDLDLLCVCRGPGSFTGLRIGITAMRTFAQTKNLPLYGVNTLHAMQYLGDPGVLPLLDARGGRVYMPGEEPDTTILTRAEELSKKTNYISFASTLLQDVLKEQKVRWLPSDTPLSPVIAKLGAERYTEGDPGDWRDLLPEYVGVSQAERERQKKERRD